MTILVSGASGQLGRLIIDALIRRGVPASDVVAGARSPQKVQGLRERGIRVVAFDYDDPDTLQAGLKGVDRFVLVSVSMPWTPLTQHNAVVAAAAAAGVSAMAYTSVYRADSTRLPLAPVHLAAEAAITASGIPTAMLRNNSYTELYFGPVTQALRTGVISAAAGEGRIAAATRADFAEAAASAITEDAYLGRVLELAGDEAFSYTDLAAAATQILGRDVTYRQLSHEQLVAQYRAGGWDETMTAVMARIDTAVAAGDLNSSDTTLSQMIGRPTTTLGEALRAAL